MRLLLVVVLIVTLPAAHVIAQSGSHPTSIAVSPSVSDLATARFVSAQNLPPRVPVTTVLFAPDGSQTATQATARDDGTVSQTLQVPVGGWQVGEYRWVVALANGTSYSQTFVATDGAPHLFAQPDSPSPTSAFNFVGIGFPPSTQVSLVLFLTGAGGQHTLAVTTDNSGSFSTFVFPQGFHQPFYAAGAYKITAPAEALSTDFMVREHPVSSTIFSNGPLELGGFLDLHFRNYPRYRYLWGVYADLSGRLQGEFMVGPTSIGGSLDIVALFRTLAPGKYLVATPYDWGEGTFDVPDPPTPAPTATMTMVPTVTPSATPRPAHRACKAKKKGTKKRRKCKKH